MLFKSAAKSREKNNECLELITTPLVYVYIGFYRRRHK
jgi:hypothetical protein